MIRKATVCFLVILLGAGLAWADFCKHCGNKTSDDAKFCTKCGKGISEESAQLFCQKCGQKNAADAEFCQKCGAKMANTTKADTGDSGPGFLNLKISPPDAAIFLDGKQWRPGRTQIEPHVRHQLTIQKDGYFDYRTKAWAMQGRTRVLDIHLHRKKHWSLGPRIGGSLSSGWIWVEGRYRNVAAILGHVPDGSAAGLRYYWNGGASSWFAGIGHVEVPDGTTDNTLLSVIGGYRWRSPGGFVATVGLGPLLWEERHHMPPATDTEYFGTVELAFGWDF
ncbi:zinc ribbon domain-containing protein [Verrucomicrobiota bacterium]